MRLALAAAALVLLAACQGPDVGQDCTLRAAGSGPAPGADWFETGNFECPNPVCIQSYGRERPYCSKACVSNRDCYTGSTGLVCRLVVLDPDFLAGLDPATRQKYLGDIQYASYCAVPLP
jgi:hypothetical protein